MTSADLWQDRIYLGGWVAGAAGIASAREVATGRELGRFGLASPADVDRAVAEVAEVQAGWQQRSGEERAARLDAVANAVSRHRKHLAEWLVREAGATRAKADRELDGAVAESRFAAELALTPSTADPHSQDSHRPQVVQRHPVGIVGVITPFNAPLILAMRAIAPALATGQRDRIEA